MHNLAIFSDLLICTHCHTRPLITRAHAWLYAQVSQASSRRLSRFCYISAIAGIVFIPLCVILLFSFLFFHCICFHCKIPHCQTGVYKMAMRISSKVIHYFARHFFDSTNVELDVATTPIFKALYCFKSNILLCSHGTPPCRTQIVVQIVVRYYSLLRSTSALLC